MPVGALALLATFACLSVYIVVPTQLQEEAVDALCALGCGLSDSPPVSGGS